MTSVWVTHHSRTFLSTWGILVTLNSSQILRKESNYIHFHWTAWTVFVRLMETLHPWSFCEIEEIPPYYFGKVGHLLWLPAQGHTWTPSTGCPEGSLLQCSASGVQDSYWRDCIIAERDIENKVENERVSPSKKDSVREGAASKTGNAERAEKSLSTFTSQDRRV